MAAIANHAFDASINALLPMTDPVRFVRPGNERTTMDWPTYRAMLEQWGDPSRSYEKRWYRASQVGALVYLDFDKRAEASEGTMGLPRYISIYQFDETGRNVTVDVIVGFHQPP